LYIPETAQKQFQYRIDFFLAMLEFKNQNPVRQSMHADYVAREIADYLHKYWNYELKPLKWK